MHTIVTDLSYGDAGKGRTVDNLCADGGVSLVVRHNGGCQAAHNVVLEDGRHHTFAQFGAGTFSNVPTFLSRFVMVEPLSMMVEAQGLAKVGVASALDLMVVDAEALLTTQFHWLVNRAREEQRKAGRHGTCGRGIGETMAYALDNPEDAPHVYDIPNRPVLRRKLQLLQNWYERVPGVSATMTDLEPLLDILQDWYERVMVVHNGTTLLQACAAKGDLVFEGAQGVLLDEWRGFHPHTTWSTTTDHNAVELLQDAGLDAYHLGVVRTFTTRHGEGPHVSENPTLRPLARLEQHNDASGFQGAFRVGFFDAVAHQYAVASCERVDGLAVTHLDWAHHEKLTACYAYTLDGGEAVGAIPMGDYRDLAFQQALTGSLKKATPMLDEFEGDPCETIGRFLVAPVVFRSAGPRRDQGAFMDWAALLP